MKNPSVGQALFFLFVVVPVGIVLSGWTITVLWDWFIVTTFKLPSLTFMQALGLSLVISYFTHHSSDKDQTVSEVISQVLTKPIVFLLMGWIVHQFI